MRAGTWVVVVGRHGPTAKSRLATVLAAEERSALALAMITDVLATAVAAGFGGVAAVIDPPLRMAGVVPVPDPGGGLARAIDAGLHAAIGARANAILIVPGDVPLVTRRDLKRVADAASEEARSVVVVPDRHGAGTNALALHPPTVIAPSFGTGSAGRHLAAASAAGARAVRLELASLALDIDTPEDLAELRRLRPGLYSDQTSRE